MKTLSEPQVHFLKGWERVASHNSTRPSAPAVQNAPAVLRAQDASTSFIDEDEVQVSSGGFASFKVICVRCPVDCATSSRHLLIWRSPQDRTSVPSRVSVRPLTAPTWAAPEDHTHCLAAKSQARTSPSAPPLTHCTSTPLLGTASAVNASLCPSNAQTKGLAIMRSSFAATTARWYSLAAAKGWCFGSKFLRANFGSAPLISRLALRAMTLTFILVPAAAGRATVCFVQCSSVQTCGSEAFAAMRVCAPAMATQGLCLRPYIAVAWSLSPAGRPRSRPPKSLLRLLRSRPWSAPACSRIVWASGKTLASQQKPAFGTAASCSIGSRSHATFASSIASLRPRSISAFE